jgi:hypothetical protein
LKEGDGRRKEGEGRHIAKKTYLSEKPPETANSSSCGNACVLYPFIACTNPALTSSLLFPQSIGPFEVEVEGGVAYAVVVDVVTPIVVSCPGGPFVLVCEYPPCPYPCPCSFPSPPSCSKSGGGENHGRLETNANADNNITPNASQRTRGRLGYESMGLGRGAWLEGNIYDHCSNGWGSSCHWPRCFF